MAEIAQRKSILAIVTTDRERVAAGAGAPVFHARDEDEAQQTAFLLSRILDAMVHDLENGVLILVRH
ncbi:MAG TPA: hypothetical protein VIK99_03825 [Thermaerobacter sp.]